MLNRVPYEIFRQIIKYSYADRTPVGSFGSYEVSLPPIKATHVCNAWRTTLLSDPTMWTCIVLTEQNNMHADILKEILPRSGSAPLDVLIDHCWDDYLIDSRLTLDLWRLYFVVSNEMHRCREFKITISVQLMPLVSHCLDKPVPLLQTFYLEVFEDESDFKPKDVLKAAHEMLFPRNAPNLKHVGLQVSAGLDDLQLSLFKNLSSLHLVFMREAVTNGDILLDIVQSSPCLRILDIQWFHFERQPVLSITQVSSRRILLPCLQKLKLGGSCSVDILDLVLGHLDFPIKNVKFDITYYDSYSKISGSLPLLNFLTRRCLTFLSIHIGSFWWTFDFVKRTDQVLRLRPEEISTFRPNVRASDLGNLPNFLQSFNLADVTHMYLEDTSFQPAFLRSIFALFRNLQCLRVTHRPIDDKPLLGSPSPMPRSYLKALVPRLLRSDTQNQPDSESETNDMSDNGLDIGPGRGQGLFPCPSLGTLELLFRNEDLPIRLDEAYLRALSWCFRIREQAGYPFKLIANCGEDLGLAEDFDAFHAREGFPIEVRSVGCLKWL